MQLYVNDTFMNEHSRCSEKTKDVLQKTTEVITECVKPISSDGELVITATYDKATSGYSDEREYFKLVLSTFNSSSDETIARKVKRRQKEAAASSSSYREIELCPDFKIGEALNDPIASLTIRVYYYSAGRNDGGVSIITKDYIADCIRTAFRQKYD